MKSFSSRARRAMTFFGILISYGLTAQQQRETEEQSMTLAVLWRGARLLLACVVSRAQRHGLSGHNTRRVVLFSMAFRPYSKWDSRPPSVLRLKYGGIVALSHRSNKVTLNGILIECLLFCCSE